MATFRPSQNVCTLNFDDKYTFTLALHEDTADAISNAFEKIKTIAPKGRAGVDDAYNKALDVIDEILGEGAADKVMSVFENPGTLEVWEVLTYIMDEWAAAYSETVDKMKQKMTVSPAPQQRGRRR